MGRALRVGFGLGFAVAMVAATFAVGCGGKPHGTDSHGGEAAAAPPPPTPDTTPIEALRTPAGLVLKIQPETTPAPSGTPAPSPSPAK